MMNSFLSGRGCNWSTLLNPLFVLNLVVQLHLLDALSLFLLMWPFSSSNHFVTPFFKIRENNYFPRKLCQNKLPCQNPDSFNFSVYLTRVYLNLNLNLNYINIFFCLFTFFFFFF